jgi:hypothetical protein
LHQIALGLKCLQINTQPTATIPYNRLFVKRKEGGRGLLQIEVACKGEILNIAEYLDIDNKEDQFVNIL